MEQSVISVKQLNMYVKSLIEGDTRLVRINVKGEISNFKNHYSSGHWYFTLKDNDAAIRCVMFRSYASSVNFNVEDGMKVVITGRASIYEKDGQYQFYAEEMHDAGIGDIALKFEQIKKKLYDEGLFDTETKRKIPEFPKNIAVITSDTGAAVQDIMNILARRYPLARVIMCPVAVQGEAAVPDILRALDRVYSLGSADVIILGRGGGSIEDLWAFNSEEIARKIYESPIPVISAVGHETDFTICDFVADLRAPTPSAAAELAVPDISELKFYLDNIQKDLKGLLLNKYNNYVSRYSEITSSNVFKKPLDQMIFSRYELIDRLCEKLSIYSKSITEKRENAFRVLTSKLDSLSPLKVMTRGYAIAEKNGSIVKSVNDVEKNDTLNINLKDGKLVCKVTEKE